MDLRELYYLNALAEEQSISKAAERLYIAQASLSQFLRQFEAQLGSPIFVRTLFFCHYRMPACQRHPPHRVLL